MFSHRDNDNRWWRRQPHPSDGRMKVRRSGPVQWAGGACDCGEECVETEDDGGGVGITNTLLPCLLIHHNLAWTLKGIHSGVARSHRSHGCCDWMQHYAKNIYFPMWRTWQWAWISVRRRHWVESGALGRVGGSQMMMQGCHQALLQLGHEQYRALDGAKFCRGTLHLQVAPVVADRSCRRQSLGTVSIKALVILVAVKFMLFLTCSFWAWSSEQWFCRIKYSAMVLWQLSALVQNRSRLTASDSGLWRDQLWRLGLSSWPC